MAGISIGLAKLLRTMGIASFEDLSAIDDATVDRLDALVGGVRDRFERNTWAEAARDLHVRKLVAAS
ncbi:MAG: hypothetical protein MUP76_03425 [Acidimicrobiia bacterium]|nr:hypothetical protein [Acidimicrobiia bacterium]